MKCTVTVKLERPLTKGTLMAGLSSATECWLSSRLIKPGMDSAVLSWATGLSDTNFYLEWIPGQNEDEVITDKELLAAYRRIIELMNKKFKYQDPDPCDPRERSLDCWEETAEGKELAALLKKVGQ